MNATSKIRNQACEISSNLNDAQILLQTIINAIDGEQDIIKLKDRINCYTQCAMRYVSQIEAHNAVIIALAQKQRGKFQGGKPT